MNLTGNTILLTGGTSGIGRALAEALHAGGNQVIITGRRQNLLDEITTRNPGMVGIAADMANNSAVQQLADKLKQQFPRLNVLINNAGIASPENYTADTVDTALPESIIQTNIISVIQLTAALLPTLRAQPHSTLMVTTSGLAFVPFPRGPVYGATKAFLHNWLDALRMQLRDTSVEVLELAPPYVQTELGGPRQASDPRAMPLDAFVSEVMDLLRKNDLPKGEILVEKVKPLRWAEKNGNYQQMLDILANMHD